MSFTVLLCLISFFFFNDTATTEIYTLSLHDALPISTRTPCRRPAASALTSRSRTRSRPRSEEHTSELQSHSDLVCRLLLEKKKKKDHKNESGRNPNEPASQLQHSDMASAEREQQHNA